MFIVSGSRGSPDGLSKSKHVIGGCSTSPSLEGHNGLEFTHAIIYAPLRHCDDWRVEY